MNRGRPEGGGRGELGVSLREAMAVGASEGE
jgi:hypothetical protein